MGGFVGFYAAQTTEATPEKRLPKGDPDRKTAGGVHLHHLPDPGRTSRPDLSPAGRGGAAQIRGLQPHPHHADVRGRSRRAGVRYRRGRADPAMAGAGRRRQGGRSMPAGCMASPKASAWRCWPRPPIRSRRRWAMWWRSRSIPSPPRRWPRATLQLADIPKGAVLRKVEGCGRLHADRRAARWRQRGRAGDGRGRRRLARRRRGDGQARPLRRPRRGGRPAPRRAARQPAPGCDLDPARRPG